MVKLRLILERIEQVRRDVKALQNLLLSKQLVLSPKPVNLPFSPEIMLKLSKGEIDVMIALRLIGGEASASQVADFLGTHRAAASQILNVLHRVGLVGKHREGIICLFKICEEKVMHA